MLDFYFVIGQLTISSPQEGDLVEAILNNEQLYTEPLNLDHPVIFTLFHSSLPPPTHAELRIRVANKSSVILNIEEIITHTDSKTFQVRVDGLIASFRRVEFLSTVTEDFRGKEQAQLEHRFYGNT